MAASSTCRIQPGGSVAVFAEIEGTSRTGNVLASAAAPGTSPLSPYLQAWTRPIGFEGEQTLNIRARFRSGTAGTTSAKNPAILLYRKEDGLDGHRTIHTATAHRLDRGGQRPAGVRLRATSRTFLEAQGLTIDGVTIWPDGTGRSSETPATQAELVAALQADDARRHRPGQTQARRLHRHHGAARRLRRRGRGGKTPTAAQTQAAVARLVRVVQYVAARR